MSEREQIQSGEPRIRPSQSRRRLGRMAKYGYAAFGSDAGSRALRRTIDQQRERGYLEQDPIQQSSDASLQNQDINEASEELVNEASASNRPHLVGHMILGPYADGTYGVRRKKIVKHFDTLREAEEYRHSTKKASQSWRSDFSHPGMTKNDIKSKIDKQLNEISIDKSKTNRGIHIRKYKHNPKNKKFEVKFRIRGSIPHTNFYIGGYNTEEEAIEAFNIASNYLQEKTGVTYPRVI